MKAKDQPRFDLDTLRERAGDKVLARGKDYLRDGLVQILALEPKRVLAHVAGTEDYRTELTGRGKTFGGMCSCPAFEDWGFCKHMVATALAANAAGAAGEADGAGALPRIREHLKRKGVSALVDLIVELAEQDSVLFRKLDVAATAMHGDDKTLEARLNKVIDSAARIRDFVDYRAAAGWAADVGAALDIVADLAPGRPGLALKLAERAIDRIEGATEAIDDSDGHCGALLERARDIHLAAACLARPEPVRLARDLFARETQHELDTFAGAAVHYAEVLGAEGLAEYRRLAAEAWEQLPARSGKALRSDDLAGDYHQLLGILDGFAEQDGDIDARIALRAKDLTSSWSYLQLAEFCLAQGRAEEALRRAEEGLWLFEDGRPDERLLLFAVKLLSGAGRKDDAEAHLWRAFEKRPSFELYARLRKLRGKAARARALKFLENQLVRQARTSRSASTDLLVEILTHEIMFAEAWAAVRKHGASIGTKQALARASDATHRREALEVYTEQVDQLANRGGDQVYAEAAKLVAHIATLQGEAERAAYLVALKARHARKRNFMKLLR